MGRKYFLLFLTLVICLSGRGFVFSQVTPARPAAAPGAKIAKAGTLNNSTNRIDYLEFRDVDIKDVLRQLAKQYVLNIVFSESVSGSVTVQLHDVTVDEALDSIITVNGFVYTRKQNVIKVTTAAEAEKEGKQTRVFRLNNADATQLSLSLQKVISADGSIQVDARSNSLIVTDIPRIINDVEKMIQDSLDSRIKQVLIEARFIKASTDTLEKIGVKWSPVESKSAMVTMTGAKRVTTAPFSANGSSSLNNIFPSMSSNAISSNSASGPYAFPYADATTFSTITDNFSYGTLDFTNLQMALDFLKTRSDAKVISSPRIITIDNKEAKIQVGKTIRIATDYTVDNETGDKTYQYEATDVGIILTVTPHITPDNYVRLNLKPEVSSIDSETSASGIDVVSKSVAETEVIIKDGQTIVIGGLAESSKSNSETKMPILGDIPLIGKMFTHKNSPDSKQDLLIFVTARIVKEDEKGAIGYKSGIITSPPRPLKGVLRDVALDDKKRGRR